MGTLILLYILRSKVQNKRPAQELIAIAMEWYFFIFSDILDIFLLNNFIILDIKLNSKKACFICLY